MRGLHKLSQGSDSPRSAKGGRPDSVFLRSKLAFRRYLLVSTGISSTAVGLALIVSFLAATYGHSAIPHLAVAEGSNVDVSRPGERLESALLETTLAVVASEFAPSTAVFPAASPAPALNVESQPAAPPAPPASLVVTPEAEAEAAPAPEPASEAVVAEATPEPEPPAAAAAQEADAEEAPPPKTPEENEIAPPGGLPSIGEIHGVNVTFYDCLDQGFCGVMYNGDQVYEGAAACSWDLPLGTRFVIQDDPTGRVYVCADRGLLPDTWVDIFFYSPNDGWAWQHQVGRYATLRILSVPTS